MDSTLSNRPPIMTEKEDILDIVNERDEVIGQTPRSQAHAQRLLHRAAHVWIFNARGELLMQRRSAFKDSYPNVWTSSVCGHVDSGESYLEAARREIQEEVGWTAPLDLKEIAYVAAREETSQEFTRLYRANCEGPFSFPSEEISELHWMSFQKIDEAMRQQPDEFAPVFCFLWKHYGSGATASSAR
ncbi:MAG: NUDIX domain-containing protein [bacterium]